MAIPLECYKDPDLDDGGDLFDEVNSKFDSNLHLNDNPNLLEDGILLEVVLLELQ